MKRVLAIAAIADVLILAVVMHGAIKDFLWTHPWWHSTLVSLPTIFLAVLSFLEWRDSGQTAVEANRLHSEANGLRARIADLEQERNQHLQQIAQNTVRPTTQAERNTDVLRRHLRSKASVSEEHGNWSDAAEIVEVRDDNIVTLYAAWESNYKCMVCRGSLR